MKRRTTNFSLIAIGIFVASFLLGGAYSMLTPSQAVAQPRADGSTVCVLKVNKQKCEDEVKKECTSTSPDGLLRCARGKAKKYTTVFKECREKKQPQSCHAKARDKCKGKTGKARTDCRKKEAKAFPKGDPRSEDDFVQFGESPETHGECGEGDRAVKTRFDFGCTGTGNPIQDVAYAIVRFLSIGVALVLVASIIYAGILYSSSEGNPEATQAAKKRVQNAVTALVFYMFIFALIQYLVPGGLFT